MEMESPVEVSPGKKKERKLFLLFLLFLFIGGWDGGGMDKGDKTAYDMGDYHGRPKLQRGAWRPGGMEATRAEPVDRFAFQ